MSQIKDMNLHCFPIQYSYHCNFHLSLLVNIVVLLINSVYLVYKFNISKKRLHDMKQFVTYGVKNLLTMKKYSLK